MLFRPIGYLKLRNGDMTLKASVKVDETVAESSLNFTYKRPELVVPVANPIAQDFPGITNRLAPTNPLTNRALDVEALPVVVDTPTIDGFKINDQDVRKSAEFTLSKAGQHFRHVSHSH